MKRLPFHVLFKRVLEEKTQPVVWRYVLCRVFMRLEEKKIKMFSLAIDWVHLIVQLEVIYAAPAFVKIAGEQVSEKMKR